MDSTLQQRVQQTLDELVKSGQEIGLQVAAYVGGELAVDAWSGVADEESGQLVDGDTLFTTWSTTKGFVATCLHILADRGQVDYDTPIAAYWPEFGAHGKAAATVRDALTHRAGVPQVPEGVTPEMMTDWDAMCAAIAALRPLWEPGSTVCYHAWTFGWIIGELVRRIDGRPIAQFAREELCQPLGIADFYLGIPDEVAARVAPLMEAPAEPETNELALRVMPPQLTSAAVLNRPDIRRASIPGGGGIMSARAIARHYAMLAQDGELDGVRILSAERCSLIGALHAYAPDARSGIRRRRGLGYALGGDPAHGGDSAMGRGGGEFGHAGNGGSLGFADPVRRLSFGLAKNRMSWPEDEAEACYRVAEVIRAYLDEAA
ncbi:beta-lactamase family protein [Chloroflexia bacterium SDU3-3]|nr:beta-lactamase family protein [Chloroflexia bacterium SDU3-3]